MCYTIPVRYMYYTAKIPPNPSRIPLPGSTVEGWKTLLRTALILDRSGGIYAKVSQE